MKEKGRSCYLQVNHVLGICKARNASHKKLALACPPYCTLSCVPFPVFPSLCSLRLQVGITQHVLLRAKQQEDLKQYLRLYHHVYLFACKHKKHEQTIRASSVLIECEASSTIRAKQDVYPSETVGP